MDDLGVIDRFLAEFVRYIDSGFGLLAGDVAFLTTVLVGIDITLAGLFWALGGEDDIIARLLKKILYVGAFALILGNFSILADIIFRSFAGLGITAGGGSMSPEDLFRPGFVAGTGFEAAWPLLDQASELLGITSFFENFLTIAILLVAWFFVVAAFFILSIQLFVTIIEFKLTALAGFVLVPFALWNRTDFLAERVLGNVISSGIKVMVLAVIVGIGSGFFGEFTAALGEDDATLSEAMSLVLGSLALLGLGIFGPSIASGLVAGAPQLGGGSALATAAAGTGSLVLGGALVGGGTRALTGGSLAAARAATAVGNFASNAMGHDGPGQFGSLAASRTIERPGTPKSHRTVTEVAGSASSSGDARAQADAVEVAPEWARRMNSRQSLRHHGHLALQALRDSDRGGAGANPDISEKED